MNLIGKRISEFRKKKSMTQEELAVKIGVSSQAISKWETGITMPDIMLLPIIADIFDLTIDELFGRHNTSVVHNLLSFDDVPKSARYAVIECMQKAWNTACKDDITVEEGTRNTSEYLSRFKESHSMIITESGGVSYAASDIALTYTASKTEMLELMMEESTVEYLKAISSDSFRKILLYYTQNNSSFTSSSIASKCGVPDNEAIDALSALERYNLVSHTELDIDGQILNVYSPYAQHKLPLICSMLRLAKALSDFKEHYRGFRN